MTIPDSVLEILQIDDRDHDDDDVTATPITLEQLLGIAKTAPEAHDDTAVAPSALEQLLGIAKTTQEAKDDFTIARSTLEQALYAATTPPPVIDGDVPAPEAHDDITVARSTLEQALYAAANPPPASAGDVPAGSLPSAPPANDGKPETPSADVAELLSLAQIGREVGNKLLAYKYLSEAWQKYPNHVEVRQQLETLLVETLAALTTALELPNYYVSLLETLFSLVTTLEKILVMAGVVVPASGLPGQAGMPGAGTGGNPAEQEGAQAPGTSAALQQQAQAQQGEAAAQNQQQGGQQNGQRTKVQGGASDAANKDRASITAVTLEQLKDVKGILTNIFDETELVDPHLEALADSLEDVDIFALAAQCETVASRFPTRMNLRKGDSERERTAPDRKKLVRL